MSSHKALVSVVVPSYNHARWLGETLDSILGQTFTDWEAVVVDDGSTDDTPEVARRYAHRIRYVRQPNSGVSIARNHGLSLTTGRHVVFLDADDMWPPAKLQLQTGLLEAKPNVGMVYGSVCTLRDGSVVGCSRPSHRGRILVPLLRRSVQLGTGAVLIRREVLERVGAFDPRFSTSADYDLWLRICGTFDVDFVDEPVLYYRIAPNAMHRDLSLIIRDPIAVLDKFFAEGPGRTPEVRRERASAYARAFYAIAGEVFHRRSLRIAAPFLLRALRADPRFVLRRLVGAPARWSMRRLR